MAGAILPALCVVFGLQLLRVLAAGTIGVDLATATLAFYALIPLATAAVIIWVIRLRGTRTALIATVAGLALARLAEQVIYAPREDLVLAIAGVTLLAVFLSLQASRQLGRGALAGGLLALGILLGFALDTALRGALGLFDLSWRREAWAIGLVALMALVQVSALGLTLRGRPSDRTERGNVGSIVLVAVPAALVLLLELLVFQSIGGQLLRSLWPQQTVIFWLVLSNTVGITIGTAILAWHRSVPAVVAMIVLMMGAAVFLERLSGITYPFILVGQAGVSAALVLAGISLGSAVRVGKLGWTTTMGGLGLLLAATLPFYLYVGYGWSLLPLMSGLATALAAVALIYALVAASTMVRHQRIGVHAWVPAVAAAVLMIVPAVQWAVKGDQSDIGGRAGVTAPEMSGFDSLMSQLLQKWRIPGGALAIAKDGRLVLARGYGWADVEEQEPVQPESLFRLASISKPVTAVAVLQLVDEGALDLDGQVFPLLDYLEPPPVARKDPRLGDVTTVQLLQHSGGWDRQRGFDPMFVPGRAARSVGVPGPASCETVVRFMLGQELSFEPGTRHSYSNFGYCVLGRLVERASGLPYEEYVKTRVLGPMGISQMRMGGSLLEDRAVGEVRYYSYSGAPIVRSVVPDNSRWVPRPYGGFYLEAMDSHGGWIGSAIDLMRFVTALDGSRSTAFNPPESLALSLSRPKPPLWVGTPSYYGMGWSVRPMGDDAIWWHSGSLDGTVSILVRTHYGMSWAALFNSRPRGSEKFLAELIQGISQEANRVVRWPDHDLFEAYAPR